MRKLMGLAVLGFSLVVGAANAADFGAYGTAGTVGLGGGIVTSFNSHLGARLGYTAFDYKVKNVESSGLSFDGTAELGGLQAMLDWYPFGGGFRVSAGVMENAKLSATAKPLVDSYTFDGVTYTTADVADARGTAEFGSLAPYLGLGFGRALSSDGRFAFTADIGVAFTGSADVQLNVTCTAQAAALCTQIQSDVAAEQAELQADADDIKYWPVLSFGVSYRF
jgi:hypothetical protein